MSLLEAIKHARKNPILPKGRNSISRFSCLIVSRNRVFRAWNSYKTHPLQARFANQEGLPKALHVHAEIAALAKASRSEIVPSLSTVYVARVLKDGTPGLAKPCTICMAALLEFGYKNIQWTTN